VINPETPSGEASLEEEPAVDRSVLVEKLFRRTEGVISVVEKLASLSQSA